MDQVTFRLVVGSTEYVLSGWMAAACVIAGVALMSLGVIWLVKQVRSWRQANVLSRSAEPGPRFVGNVVRNKALYDGWYYSDQIYGAGTINDIFFHVGEWTDADKQRWREWRKRTKNFHMAEEPWRAGEFGYS